MNWITFFLGSAVTFKTLEESSSKYPAMTTQQINSPEALKASFQMILEALSHNTELAKKAAQDPQRALSELGFHITTAGVTYQKGRTTDKETVHSEVS